jgi:ATP-dependent RNA helicase RhlE
VHRIGRTGRAGGVGHAISFATPDQKMDLRKIERLIRGTLPLSKIPELPPTRIAVGAPVEMDRPLRRFGAPSSRPFRSGPPGRSSGPHSGPSRQFTPHRPHFGPGSSSRPSSSSSAGRNNYPRRRA